MTQTAKTLTGAALAAAVLAVVVGVAAAALASHGRFSDLPPGHRHAAAIAEAHHKGLFEGYGDGTFRPDRVLTNRQAETVLRRMLDRYTGDDGNSTLTRAQAAVLLARGVCGLDGDCRDIPPVHAPPGGPSGEPTVHDWQPAGPECDAITGHNWHNHWSGLSGRWTVSRYGGASGGGATYAYMWTEILMNGTGDNLICVRKVLRAVHRELPRSGPGENSAVSGFATACRYTVTDPISGKSTLLERRHHKTDSGFVDSASETNFSAARHYYKDTVVAPILLVARAGEPPPDSWWPDYDPAGCRAADAGGASTPPRVCPALRGGDRMEECFRSEGPKCPPPGALGSLPYRRNLICHAYHGTPGRSPACARSEMIWTGQGRVGCAWPEP